MAISIDLAGKTILICGVARGTIGAATMRRLAEAGASLAIVDYRQDIVDEALRDLARFGGSTHGIVANLLEPGESDRIVPEVLGRMGALDGVANIAGGVPRLEYSPLETTSTEAFRENLNLNLEYVFRICRDAAASMIERGVPGSLVNVGSISALSSAPHHGPYGAAKSGVAALTRTMAFEWGRYGIRANTVNPGAVYTERNARLDQAGTAAAGSNGERSDLVWTSTDEMADGIVFLLSDRASGITGQTLTIDSGLSTKFCGGARRLEINKQVAPG